MNQLNAETRVSTHSLTHPKSVQFKSKAEKKREKELKKIAQQQNQKRDHLSREEKFAEVSKRRGWDEWQSWCEDVKIDELRNDLSVLSKSVIRLMDNSNKTIETIKTHREHAEEQYLRNFQEHSQLVDYIMNLFKIFKDSSDQMYEQERERLVSDFYQEAFNRDSVQHRRKTFYENLTHATVSLMKCDLNQMAEKFGDRKVEVESDSFIKREASGNRAMKRESTACAEIRNLVNVFENHWWPKSRYDKYKETLKKSVEVDKSLEELRKKIGDSLKAISNLDNKLQTFTREFDLTTTELRSEHRFMCRIMQQVEETVKQESLWDQDKMIHLVSVCEKTKQMLREMLDRGKTIESATKVCKKFEKLSDELESSESSEDFTSEIDSLLFRKLANVEAECVILRCFKASLKAKNEKLAIETKAKRQEFEVKRSMAMLRLDLSPSIGQICQVSHQISQITLPIMLRKRYTLCKFCKHDFKL